MAEVPALANDVLYGVGRIDASGQVGDRAFTSALSGDGPLSVRNDRYCTITIPGTGPDVITVGAIEARPQPAVYENGSLGPNADEIMKPDLVAPGIDVASARAGTDADVMSEARSGASFAAPHVAGCLSCETTSAYDRSPRSRTG